MSRIMCLGGVPKKIVLDRGSQFTSKFWEKLHESMDTKLNFSSAYHPQTDGQVERTNQGIEDVLRACVLKYGKSWDKSLPYAEFSYSNSYCRGKIPWWKITTCKHGKDWIPPAANG
jgi:transposase InsO family protein